MESSMPNVCLSRRAFLGHALALTSVTLPVNLLSASPRARADVIDIHFHVTTQAVRSLASSAGGNAAMLQALQPWRPAEALEQMDAARVALSVISTPVVPPVWKAGPQAYADFARANNEEMAAIVKDAPHRFAFFAYLPLPHVKESIREIEYALDTLHADGVYMCTSYGTTWLGDESMGTVMAELNARRAVVYTHPMGASCCVAGFGPNSSPLLKNVPPTVIEYGTDTTRAIASLIFSGAARKFADIRFIFSHAGGTAPYLIERFEQNAKIMAQGTPEDPRALLRGFFYDTAQAANPLALGTLLKLVPSTQILFGSDAPWRDQMEQLRAIEAMRLGPSVTEAIRQGNARRLLPRSIDRPG
jgi:6-methylsalicylate decarboxylase